MEPNLVWYEKPSAAKRRKWHKPHPTEPGRTLCGKEIMYKTRLTGDAQLATTCEACLARMALS